MSSLEFERIIFLNFFLPYHDGSLKVALMLFDEASQEIVLDNQAIEEFIFTDNCQFFNWQRESNALLTNYFLKTPAKLINFAPIVAAYADNIDTFYKNIDAFIVSKHFKIDTAQYPDKTFYVLCDEAPKHRKKESIHYIAKNNLKQLSQLLQKQAKSVAIPQRSTTLIKAPNTEFVKAKYGYFAVDNHDAYVSSAIKLYGEYAEKEVSLFKTLLKPGSHVIEVGSNIGTHTIPLARIVGPAGVVHAYEPQLACFKLLTCNVLMNECHNIKLHDQGVGDQQQQIWLTPLLRCIPQNFGGYELQHEAKGKQPANITTLDHARYQRCDLLKVDAEGMEMQVLKGAKQLLETCQPYVFIEVDRENAALTISKYLKQLGYAFSIRHDRLYSDKNFNHNPDNVYGELVSKNMLAVPPHKQHLFRKRD